VIVTNKLYSDNTLQHLHYLLSKAFLHTMAFHSTTKVKFTVVYDDFIVICQDGQIYILCMPEACKDDAHENQNSIMKLQVMNLQICLLL